MKSCPNTLAEWETHSLHVIHVPDHLITIEKDLFYQAGFDIYKLGH